MRTTIALLAAIALTACVQPVELKPVALSQAQQADVKTTMAYNLFDPSSAQFRNLRAADVTLSDGRTVRRVCGEINGKNQLGGYAGFQPFGGFITNGKFETNYYAGPCA